mmetsp:Transcript_11519/g.33244  ORF Transcript_11519/g.33244 Transcript_11519/m.33244 type:complete len:502 (-) Transcript_11519:22-1527(-)
MLVLFETPAGYALFKVLDEAKLASPDDLANHFSDAQSAAKIVKLKAFSQFTDTVEAVAAASSMVEGSMGKQLKKFLSKQIVKKELKDKLVVADKALGGIIKEKLNIKCVHESKTNELLRCMRSQLESLLGDGVSEADMRSMRLGLSHSLSRYKLKFSPDKVDTMIVQAIGLLDELDKEINTYAMRVKEWYGWHYPEMAKIVTDTIVYSKVVLRVGLRTGFRSEDLSDLIEDESIVQSAKETAEISMGTELAEMDLANIQSLATEVVSMSEYRIQLFDYLKNRMQAIAPNLTVMVGELVGARLIAHAGSLMNLAKHPASTVQILGAEKALFRALKTKHDTPKYGLIYHASLIGQTAPKHKGKISRVLAAKTALAIRVDAMGETEGATIGYDNRAMVEQRIRQLEGGGKLPLPAVSQEKYSAKDAKAAAAPSYNTATDVVQNGASAADADSKKKDKKKRAREENGDEDSGSKSKKKDKKDKKVKKEDEDSGEKKKKKKAKKSD